MLSRVRWIPQVGPQTDAYLSKADHLLYGGAAAGGKTDLLLGLAYNNHSKSIIYRREFSQLQALIDRSHELFDGWGDFRASPHPRWVFKKGTMLEFEAAQHLGSERKMQGRDHDFIGFDEATHFSESQFRFLTGWLRTTKKGQRTRVVCASNPPSTTEGAWIKRYWAPWLVPGHSPSSVPGESLFYSRIQDEDYYIENAVAGQKYEIEKRLVTPISRTFIPARLTDNEFINPEYEAQLEAMPEPLRSQLLYGDMQIEQESDPWQTISKALVDARCILKRDYQAEDVIEQVGVDVARGGQDETTVALRCTNHVLPLIKWPGRVTTDGPKTAFLVAEALKKHECESAPVVVDVVGVGAAVYDSLRGLLPNVYAFNGAESSKMLDRSKRLRMRNRRAESYWNLREWLDDPENPLYLPDDEKLKADLAVARWELTPQGILIESKDHIKERLGRSPDAGDAVAMACVDLNATNWRGLLEFAKQELAKAAADNKREDAEVHKVNKKNVGVVLSTGDKPPPSPQELMEKYGRVLFRE